VAGREQDFEANFSIRCQTLWDFVVSQLLSNVSTNLIEANTVRASRRLDEASHPLAKLGIWHPDHCGVADRRMGNQDFLDFDPGKCSNRRE
jgi:hypothetical protein